MYMYIYICIHVYVCIHMLIYKPAYIYIYREREKCIHQICYYYYYYYYYPEEQLRLLAEQAKEMGEMRKELQAR